MSKHTPGPWKWVRRQWGSSDLISETAKHESGWEEGRPIVVIDDGSNAGEYPQVINPNGPDACLIAAAPDMLEALRYVQRYHANEGSSFHLVDDAIAKAEGK